MVTSSNPTATTDTASAGGLSIADAADVLQLDAETLLDEIRSAAAAAERPSARD